MSSEDEEFDPVVSEDEEFDPVGSEDGCDSDISPEEPYVKKGVNIPIDTAGERMDPDERMDPPPTDNEFNNDEDNSCIDAVNRLRNALSMVGKNLDSIHVPEIAVVGIQGAGKSSVLESFVGRDFLPCGLNCVTRNPIVVHLVPHREEYGEFHHKGGQRFTDFDEIRNEIERFSNAESKPNNFSNKKIQLTIYSPNVVKLTLVDLPGIIKCRQEDQDPDCIKLVEDMVLDYISPESVMILAVTPATIDATTSDALAFAERVDPHRTRTIGVLTQVDRMQPGTNACQILQNRVFPLKKGWVGVVNRSPEDMKNGRDREFILRKEREIFNNPVYSHLSTRMGTPYLQKLLQRELRVHIKENLGSIRSEINEQLKGYERELQELVAAMGAGPDTREYFVIKKVQAFKDYLQVYLMGHSEHTPSDSYTAGAIINFKFYTEIYEKITSLALVPSDQKLRMAIINLNGVRNSISFNGLVVNSECQNLLENYKKPILESVLIIKEVLLLAVDKSAMCLDGCPALKNELSYLVKSWIDEACTSTTERLQAHIDVEKFFFNYLHPDFNLSECSATAPSVGPTFTWSEKFTKTATSTTTTIDDSAASSSGLNGSSDSRKSHTSFEESLQNDINMMNQSLENNDHVQKQVTYVKAAITNYLKIISKQIFDMVSKYLAYFLVKMFTERVCKTLVPTIITPSNLEKFSEDYRDDYRRAEELRLTIESLKAALDAIRGF